MTGLLRGYRGNLPVLFICITVTITVTTFVLLMSQDILSGDSMGQRSGMLYQRGLLSKEVDPYAIEKDLWPRLMLELVRKLNTSSGPLININVTNIIQAGDLREELLNKYNPKKKDNKKNTTQLAIDNFKPVMNDREKAILYEALNKMDQVCRQYNFTYMMYSGTLLGSYRHHGMVPWDDDFDVFMNYTEREKIVTVLGNLLPDFEVASAGSRVKFFSTKGIQTSKYPWKWPYIDISFFKENERHSWDGSMEDDYGDRFYMYKKDIVFPLHRRPMGMSAYNAPRDSFAHLRATYGTGILDACYTSHYSHRYEQLNEKTFKISCSELSKIYPFVHRSKAVNGVRETLKLDDGVIHSMVVREPSYAIAQPYKVALYRTMTEYMGQQGVQ